MKTAKEMLEKLGYGLIFKDAKTIVYEKIKSNKTYRIVIHDDTKEFIKYERFGVRPITIWKEELEAIILIVKELGWLNE